MTYWQIEDGNGGFWDIIGYFSAFPKRVLFESTAKKELTRAVALNPDKKITLTKRES